ncbi:MarR family transcriptional regulator [Corallococcus exiguus]|uniref:MarR family transcriptional regulator n=1 Tax=Corallococcus TaxID=83461 RepID=UPI0011C47660|nr:MarR family transcriptional regulator [Corallococcus sp. AB032C]NNB84116.1 MarR family transcriptional regulator [Corallococcus exiguus]NNB94506.1 MarR family transcriptional regulator [Corallococcus exiguus]NNC03451.1 MarR family transcriptional regulator [Corallococcus exiguus]NPC48634.1 MarR family transcriptional regulator [Corallococcus exiguus]
MAASKSMVGLTAGLLVGGHKAARLLEAELEATGLSAGEAVLLSVLASGAMTMTGVMSVLHIGASTATSLVSRLEKHGYVRRSRNPEDGRSLLVAITDSGAVQCEAAEAAFAKVDAKLAEAGRDAVRGHTALMKQLSGLT